jgi:recombination protein RecA
MAVQARLMSQALRKLAAVVSNSKTIVCFINQIRQKIGGFYGPSETTAGGNALKFYASVRLEIRPGSKIKDGDEMIGSETKIKVVKNKLAPPFKQADVSIIWGKGICELVEMLALGEEYDIITKAGSHYSYGEIKLGQGSANAKAFLEEHPKVFLDIKQKLKEAMGLATIPKN